MKKIFTVLLAAGTFAVSSAQPGQKNGSYNDSKNAKQSTGVDYAYQSPGNNNNKSVAYENSSFSFREKEMQLQRINREYDQKIAYVKKNRRMNSWEKSKQIKTLENQRRHEISQVQYRYKKNNRKDFDRNNSRKW